MSSSAGTVSPAKPPPVAVERKTGVTPIPQSQWSKRGDVSRSNEPSGSNRTILAHGLAPILHGDEKRAQQNALRDAYRNAISQGVGLEVGHMSQMRNFKELVDIVVTRSVGMVKHCDIINQGTTTETPPNYQVSIRAEVGPGSKTDLMALALFLQVLDNPKVLILLEQSESDTNKADSLPHHAAPVEATEDAFAHCFHTAGYIVMTSKDVSGANQELLRELNLAKQGSTDLARKIGLRYGVDVVICGDIQIVNKPVRVYDFSMTQVHLVATVRAIVTGSRQVLAMDQQSYEAGGSLYEATRDKLLATVVKTLAEKLVWKIPEELATHPTLLTVTLSNCTLEELKAVEAALSTAPEIDTIRTGPWLRQSGRDSGVVEFEIRSGFLQASTEDLLTALRTNCSLQFRVDALSKYNLELAVKPTAISTATKTSQ